MPATNQAVQDEIAGEKNVNKLLFVGVCESALIRGDGLWQDFYSVGTTLFFPFFPQSLSGVRLLFAVKSELGLSLYRAELRINHVDSPTSSAILKFQGKAEAGNRPLNLDHIARHWSPDEKDATPIVIDRTNEYHLLALPCPPLVITKPGDIEVSIKDEEETRVIGRFACRHLQPAPLSNEERLAIRSIPGALRAIRIEVACSKCYKKAAFHSFLEDNDTATNELAGSILLRDAPPEWKCDCGEVSFSTQYLRSGFDELFRRPNLIGDAQNLMRFSPHFLYPAGAITALILAYRRLLVSSSDDENAIQKFMEDTPLIWHFLAPKQIWKKPPLLADYKADFAILNRSQILYLIEIEKPSTKLTKSDGGISAELQKGLNQLRDWNRLVQDHRIAVLNQLGLEPKQVHDVRFVLIAGMSTTSEEHLNILQRDRSIANLFFCFDELSSFLDSIATAVRAGI